MRYRDLPLAGPAEKLASAGSRFANGQEARAISLRRLILELWAMLVLAGVVGFMGPFGTWGEDALAVRIGEWGRILAGAWLLVRPAILLLEVLARRTGLPSLPMVFWGVVLTSGPIAVLWRTIGQDEFRRLDGYTGVIPFSLLSALAVLAVVRWAESADGRLRARAQALPPFPTASLPGSSPRADPPRPLPAEAERLPDPALRRRLPPGFEGPVVALQSEDHYVRVHGAKDSVLLLMRLRDAIAEMGGVPGEQVHRSWWVARAGMAGAEASGRNWTIRLANGAVAPVARESAARLQRAGFLPRTPA